MHSDSPPEADTVLGGLPGELLVRTGLLSRDSFSGILQVRTDGACMEPAIHDGDRLLVEVGRPLPGDIVVFFDRHQRLVAHRLLGKRWGRGRTKQREWSWVSAADRANRLDRPIEVASMIGVVRKIGDHPYRASWAQRLHSLLRYARFGAAALGRGLAHWISRERFTKPT